MAAVRLERKLGDLGTNRVANREGVTANVALPIAAAALAAN